MSAFFRTSLIVVVAATAALPAAAATSIDISGSVNQSLANYTNGSSYPMGGETVTINGVAFTMAGSSNSRASIIQTTFRNSPSDITIGVSGVANVDRFYTLINTAFGNTTGVETGFIEFLFNGGATYRYMLTYGVNTRDHFGNATVSNVFGTASYSGNVRFDAQEIVLPTALQQLRLQSIRLFDTAPQNNAGGSPFLAAISYLPAVAGVPEPATWGMMIVGFGAVGGALRRRGTRPAPAIA